MHYNVADSLNLFAMTRIAVHYWNWAHHPIIEMHVA